MVARPARRGVLARALPAALRGRLGSWRRALALRLAMRRFLAEPEAFADASEPGLRQLVFGWANESFSAHEEYLAGCVREALATPGPILECGSGLSTLLVGAICDRRGLRCWSLEHHPPWAAQVGRALARHRIRSVALCCDPLVGYGDFRWYAPLSAKLPARFELVLCDGPPASTPGGRYGLVPVMRAHLGAGSVILLDDAGRDDERRMIARWAAELPAEVRFEGARWPYARLTVG